MEDKLEKTTIAIAHKNWERLSGLKRVGESFDDVIQRLIDYYVERERSPSGRK